MFSEETVQQIKVLRRTTKNKTIGFTCSCFDILHTGHALMLEDAKRQCDILIVGLQTDPTIDRPTTKNKPIQSFEERRIMIESIRFVDYIIEYATESDLYQILEELQPDVRIIGSDWKGKAFTGHDITTIPIYWHERTHSYSTTRLRRRIFEAEKQKINHHH